VKAATKNATSFNFATAEYSAKFLLDFVFLEQFILQVVLDDESIKQRAPNASPGGPTQAFINNLFVDAGKDRILVDAGYGPALNGSLMDELTANGIDKESIAKVLLTHGHDDHIADLFKDVNAAIPSFPNAKYYVSKTE
jgi:glyoxylase-like metal-dependent hydrolase (beta-lactamase superfamily II)